MGFKPFGREPSVIITFIGAVLAYAVTYNIDGLSELQAAAIMGALGAIVALVNAIMVRPVTPAIVNGAATALTGLVIAYGFDMTPEQIAGIQAIALALLGFLGTRPQVDPPVSVDGTKRAEV